MRLPTSGSLHMKALIIWLILALSNNVGESSHGSSSYIRRLNFEPHGKHSGLSLYQRRLKFSRRGKFKRSTHKSPPINIPTSPLSPSYTSDPSNYSPPYPYNPSTSFPSPPLNTPTNSFAPSESPSSHPNDQISPSTSVFSPWTTNNPPIFTITPSQSPTNSFPPSLSPSINPPMILFSPSPSVSPPNNPASPIMSLSPPFNPPMSHLTPSVAPLPSTTPSHFPPSISPSSFAHNPPTIPLTPPMSQSSPPLNPSSTPLAPLISTSNPFISVFAPSINPSNPPISLSAPSISPSTPPVVSPSASPSPSPENSINSSKSLGLQVGFYRGLCPNKKVDVEATITARVQQHFQNDPTLLAAILRMQFHDCFVHGCDASILIDGPSSEKNAGPNLSVRGYEFIDTLKEVAETECPGVVSCADIIAIATKELIKLGGGPEYLVQTGRRDGLISDAQDVRLPSPFASVDQSISAFGSKMFTPEEMVVLLGCHTVGISHCAFFQDRLYKGTSQFDPKMDPNLRRQLIPTCPQDTITNNFTSLDQNPQSSNLFDNSFFDQILKQRGILPIDQALARDPKTRGFVLQFARNAALFNTKLVDAMLKLQALEVLTGNQGEIRKVCSRFN